MIESCFPMWEIREPWGIHSGLVTIGNTLCQCIYEILYYNTTIYYNTIILIREAADHMFSLDIDDRNEAKLKVRADDHMFYFRAVQWQILIFLVPVNQRIRPNLSF